MIQQQTIVDNYSSRDVGGLIFKMLYISFLYLVNILI